MQTVTSRYPNNLSQQSRKVAIMAILLFALAGLLSGFAVGAFVHPKSQTGNGTGTDTNGSKTTPVAHTTPTQVSSAVTEHINLNEPVIPQGSYSYVQSADGSTNYTFSALIINKNNTPIQASDVTCKLWLTKDGDVNSILRAGNYALLRSIDTIQQPFPKEIEGTLNYIAPSQQIQPCAPTGKTSWGYTISQSADPGTYSLVVLADWKGKSFNWSWVIINIKKAH